MENIFKITNIGAKKGYGVLEWRSLELMARGLELQMDSTVRRSPDLAAAWRSDSQPPWFFFEGARWLPIP